MIKRRTAAQGTAVALAALMLAASGAGPVVARPLLPASGVGCFGPFFDNHRPVAMVVDERRGRAFLADDRTGDVTMLDGHSGAPLRTIHVGGINLAEAVDRSTGHIFIADGNRTVRMLDARSGNLLRSITVGTAPVAVAVDEGARRAVVVEHDSRSVSILDTRTGRIVRTTPLRESPVALAIDRVRHRVFVLMRQPAADRPGTVEVLDELTNTNLGYTKVGRDPNVVVVDGRTGRAFVAGSDEEITILDLHGTTAAPVVVTRTVSVGGPVSDIGLDERTGHVFVARGDAGLSVLDAGDALARSPRRPGQLLRTVGHSLGFRLLVDEPVGHVFLNYPQVGSGPPGSGWAIPTPLTMVDAATGTVVRTLALGVLPRAMAVDQTTGRVFVITGESTLQVLDGHSGAVLHISHLSAFPTAIAVDERTGHAYVANYNAGTISTIDGATGAVTSTAIGPHPDALAVIRDQRGQAAVLVTSYDGQVSVLDPLRGRIIHTVVSGPAPLAVAATAGIGGAPRRAYVVNCGGRGSLSILDGRTGALVHTVPTRANPAGLPWPEAYRVAVDERTRHVFVLNNFGQSVSMLDAATGALLRTVPSTSGAMALDRRAGHLFVSDPNNVSVEMLDTLHGRVVRSILVGGAPGTIAVDEHNGRAFVTLGCCDGPYVTKEIDTRTGAVLRTLHAFGQMVAADGATRHVFVVQTAVAGGAWPSSGRLSTLDERTGALVGSVALGEGPSAIAVDSRHGRIYVANALDDTISVINARTGLLLRTVSIGAALAQ